MKQFMIILVCTFLAGGTHAADLGKPRIIRDAQPAHQKAGSGFEAKPAKSVAKPAQDSWTMRERWGKWRQKWIPFWHP